MTVPMRALLEHAFTVDTIMTPRAQFLTWTGRESLEELWQEARRLKIDTIPIIEDDKITSVLYDGSYEPTAIGPDRLVAHSTSIAQVLELLAAENAPFFVFVTFHEMVAGLVTPSDLNKLSARTYFYNLLAGLEMLIAEYTRQHFADRQMQIFGILEERWKGSEDRLAHLRQIGAEIEKMHQADLEIDVVHLLNLSDMVELITAERGLRELLGFSSLNQVDTQLGGLTDWRNAIMHPVRLVLPDSAAVPKINERVKRARMWIERWNADLASPPIEGKT